MVNLSVANIFGWDTVKVGVVRVKVQFGKWIEKDGLIRISSVCVEVGNLLLVKCNQALSKFIKKS